MIDKIILYGSPTCAMVSPVRNTLDRANVGYEYVDIYLNPEGRERVLEVNNGNASVPTLVFPDGSTLTEPSVAALQSKLTQMGHQVRSLSLIDRLQAIIEYPMIFILGLFLLAFGIYNRDNAQIILGVVIVSLRLIFLLVRRRG